MHEVFSEKGPLTCEMTLTQALGSGHSRHSQDLGQTPPALGHLPLEREAVRNFLPFLYVATWRELAKISLRERVSSVFAEKRET